MNRLAVVLAFVLGSGLAWALAARGATRPVAPPAGPPRTGGLDQILSAVARIEARLDARGTEFAEEPAPNPDPAGGTEEALAEVSAALDELRLELARVGTLPPRPWWDGLPESEAALRGGYDLAPLKEQQPAPNWTTLRELIGVWNRDQQTARQSTLLLGYRDVLERFGTPTEVWANDKGLNWLYVDGVDPFTGENQLEVWLQFHDGFATQLGIKQP